MDKDKKETKRPNVITLVGYTILGTIVTSAVAPAIISNTKIAILIPFSVFMIGCVLCQAELNKVVKGYET